MPLMSSSKRKRRQTLAGFLFLGIALLIIGAIIGIRHYAQEANVPLDKETLCPINGPKSITVLVLDLTDPFTLTQREALRKKLTDIKDDLPVLGEIEVYLIQPLTDKLLSPLLTICNPGRGKDVNPLIANRNLFERKWHEYSQRLETKLDETIQKPLSDPVSPIIESLKSIAISSFAGKPKRDIDKKLIVVSDMIQHSLALNQYTDIKPFSSFQQSNDFFALRSDLRDVNVTVIYVRRSNASKIQGRKHIEFWQNYFSAMGASLSEVISLD
jgi:hypothetical protein